MLEEWDPKVLLPDLYLENAIGNDKIALAPARDKRVKAIAQAHPTFKDLLSRFKDSFGVTLEPASLIVYPDLNAGLSTTAALSSFRDVAAASVILFNRSENLIYPGNPRVLWSEAFSFYPWMLEKDFEGFSASTPAMWAIHRVADFAGQSSPMLSRVRLRHRDRDLALFDELLRRWERCYAAERPDWEDLALMRSLNMAHQAMMLPAGVAVGIYDVGRIISLWVSAFEILAHPGGEGKSGLEQVLDLLERTPWAYPWSAEKIHATGWKKFKADRTFSCLLYQWIYSVRNDFLHGNPIDPECMKVPELKLNIFEAAAPLYRIALGSFLQMRFPWEAPANENAEAVAAYVCRKMDFEQGQKGAEKALDPRREAHGLFIGRR